MKEGGKAMNHKEFLVKVNDELMELEKEVAVAYWNLTTTGKKEWEKKFIEADIKLREYLSDRSKFELVNKFLQNGSLSPLEKRELLLLKNAMLPNQIDKKTLKTLSEKEAEIESIFTSFRGEIDGKKLTNNEIEEILRKEKDSSLRKKAWEASKGIGEVVGPKILELVKIRNKIARGFGYSNYYEMLFELQELDVDRIHGIFKEFKNKTDETFKTIKEEVDTKLSEQFGVSSESLMPWHYSDPFFQEAPHIYDIPFDEVFNNLNIEKLVERTYNSIGMDVSDILKRSDLYEREGKNQHAFCIHIDRSGDVRILANLRPNERWAETMLHEMGHAVYDKYLNMDLPFLLREPSHIFTTEAVAMFFGRFARKWIWYKEIVEVEKQLKDYKDLIDKLLKLQLMISARWIITFVFFERKLYETEKNINNLWYDFVSENQFLNIPEDRRNRFDWASKIHFGANPVYYQNYLLGELMASQMDEFVKANISSLPFKPEVGRFFIEKIFKPGSSLRWDELLTSSTGETLNPDYLINQLV